MKKFYLMLTFVVGLILFSQTALAQCSIQVTISSASWGDGTTWTLTDNDGTVVLSGGTYGNGYSDTQTLSPAGNPPYTLTVVSTLGDNSPNYEVQVDGDVVFSGTAPAAQTTVLSPIACPPPPPPAPEQDPSLPTCADGTDLTVPGMPDPGIAWYWQSSATGTSTADEVDGAFTVFTNGNYYVRALELVSGLWSDESSITISNIPTSPAPPAPVASSNPACISTDLTVAAPPAQTAYFWQGTDEFGTSSAQLADVPFPVSSSGTYYVSAYDSVTMCWSQTSSQSVIINTDIPAPPIVAQTVYNFCASDPVMEIEATPLPPGCPIQVTISSAGWGDVTTWQVTDNDGIIVLSGGPYGNGYNDSQTIPSAANGPYTLTIVSTATDNSPNYSVSVDGTVVFSGTAPAAQTTVIAPFQCAVAGGDIEWYDQPTGGNLLGTGSVLNALGTSVLPIAANGTYQFYAATAIGACQSATRVLVEVIVTEVNINLIAIDETCINYADGSFALGTVFCGTAPFSYSIDGGAFDPTIPTNLAAGSYQVVIEDNAGLQSSPITLVIGSVGTVIPAAPIANTTEYFACVGETSIVLGDVDLTWCPIEVTISSASWGDGTTWEVADNDGVVVLSGGTYGNGYSDTQTIPTADNGPYTLTIVSIYTDNSPNYSVSVDGTVVLSGTATAAQTTVLPSFQCAIGGADIEWYDAASGGNLIGTGDELEAVGTTLIAGPGAAAGSYDFFLYTNLDGCFSVDNVVITVNVDPVNVIIDPIAVTCNNSETGTFEVTDTLCGDAPFLYSLDGGAFGAIPTNLAPGTHQITVQDDNGDESGVITIIVPDADEPQDLVLISTTDEGGSFEWTAGGSETSWYVEWGLPGFAPGTGAEIGSAVVSDPEIEITGLDDQTEYDVYVAADCGAGSVVGDWTGITFVTDCAEFPLPFQETFEETSSSRDCWFNEYEDGTADWTYETGALGGTITSAFEGDLNARFVSQAGNNFPITKLVSPRIDNDGQDSLALTFAYGQQSWGTQNITRVYIMGPMNTWTMIQEYTNNVDVWTVDTLFLPDSTKRVAFEGVNNWGRANVIDDVNIFPCNLTPGVDGEADICRLDEIVDLNTVITAGETFGEWVFPANPGILNGSLANISTFASGSYDFYYITKTPCATDTVIATLNIFPQSSAGQNGTIAACRNQPINLFDGLNGNVDLGGQWYDPSGNPISGSQPVSSNIPGSFNYDYIVSNGVCPADTQFVEVIVGTCDWLSVGTEEMQKISVFPNPATEVLNIVNGSNLEGLRIEMYDATGRLVLTDNKALVNALEATISIAHLETGAYTMRVRNNEGEKVFKIIKQ